MMLMVLMNKLVDKQAFKSVIHFILFEKGVLPSML